VIAAAALLAVALLPGLVFGQAAARRFVPVPEKSEVSFSAGHPLGDFTGRTSDIGGEFRFNPLDLRAGVAGALIVKAGTLKTREPKRDRDMYRVLAVDRYPDIRFTVEKVDASFPSIADRSDVLLTITGTMSIRGVDRTMVFPARARVRDNKLWVRGETDLKLADFGIKPPSRYFFTMKDAVFVGFDVTLAPE
jgi:polyisoprenoid-binding protein YceI